MLPASVPLRYTLRPELSMVAATCIQYAVSDSVTRFQPLSELSDSRAAFALLGCTGHSVSRREA